MEIEIRERAARFKRIHSDEAFQEVIEGVRQEQVDTFLSVSATIEQITAAKDILRALDAVEVYIQRAIDAGYMHDSKDN
jgi:predicted nucleic acid-binding protein